MSTVQSQLKSHKNLQIITLYKGKKRLKRQYSLRLNVLFCLASFKTLATFELKHNFCVVKYNHNLH